MDFVNFKTVFHHHLFTFTARYVITVLLLILSSHNHHCDPSTPHLHEHYSTFNSPADRFNQTTPDTDFISGNRRSTRERGGVRKQRAIPVIINNNRPCQRLGPPRPPPCFTPIEIMKSSQFNHATNYHEQQMCANNKPSSSNSTNVNIEENIGRRKENKATKTLKIMNVNCRSLISGRKHTQMEQLIETHKPDVILATETHIDDTINSREIFNTQHFLDPPPYRRDKALGEGGVLIAVNNEVLSVQNHIDADCQIVWTKISLTRGNIHIGCFYRQPSSGINTMEQLYKSLRTLYNENETIPHVLLGGDFNLPDINWDTLEINRNPQYPKCISEKMLEIMNDFHLTQLVKDPTRGNNTLDLILSSIPDLLDPPEIHPGMSDHDIVICRVKSQTKIQHKPPRIIFQYDKGDINEIHKALTNNFSTFRANALTSDVNTNWESFKELIITAMNTHIPQKVVSGKTKLPYITQNIKRMIRKKQKLYDTAKSTGKEQDWQTFREIRTKIHKDLKTEHKKYVCSLLDIDHADENQEPCHGITKRFWRYIKSKRKDSSGINILQRSDKSEATDGKEKANILNQQYQSVFSNESPSLPALDDSKVPRMPRIDVTINGVIKQLKELNPSKATGPDSLPARILKETAETSAPYLCLIFQQSLDTGSVPHDWRKANITPVFKKGRRDIASNYRPISLTSVSCKVLEHIIFHSVIQHLEFHNVLVHYQHGFRKNHSCETQLITTLEALKRSHDNKKQIDLLVLDFSKAFDTVPHQRLVQKLQHYGIHDNDQSPPDRQEPGKQNLLSWFRNWLCYRTQCVTIEGHSSEPCDVKSGVPQGTVLGPLCFLIFINDLGRNLSPETHLKLFADDSLLFREIETSIDTVILQKDLESLLRWAERWHMKFHPEKCFVMTIKASRTPHVSTYKIYDQTLTRVESLCYLGIHINNRLKWDDHIRHITTKANRSLGFIRRNLYHCPQKVKAHAYTALVRPILEYASAAWDPHLSKDIHEVEKIQRKAARFVTNCRSTNHGCVTHALEKLQWQTLETRRRHKRLTIMFKLTRDHEIGITIPGYFTTRNDSYKTRSFHTSKFTAPYTRTNIYKNSFFPRTISEWNDLPNNMINCLDAESFSAHLV